MRITVQIVNFAKQIDHFQQPEILMKKIFLSLLTFFVSLTGFFASAQQAETLFPYPQPPKDIENFYQRCTYIVEHFWDMCEPRTAFSSRERLKSAFSDYISLASQTNADTVMMSIDKFIRKVEKDNPKNLLPLGQIAEAVLMSDTSEIHSEQLFLPFAKAVAGCKKINAEDRKHFEKQVRILSSTQEGMIAPDFAFTTPDGAKSRYSEIPNKRMLMIIADPSDSQTRMMLVRLSADYNLKKLLEKNYLQLVLIYPAAADDKWRSSVSDLPAEWTLGASEEIGDYYDLNDVPIIVYITPDGKILSKKLDKERIIGMLRMLNTGQSSAK